MIPPKQLEVKANRTSFYIWFCLDLYVHRPVVLSITVIVLVRGLPEKEWFMQRGLPEKEWFMPYCWEIIYSNLVFMLTLTSNKVKLKRDIKSPVIFLHSKYTQFNSCCKTLLINHNKSATVIFCVIKYAKDSLQEMYNLNFIISLNSHRRNSHRSNVQLPYWL